VEIAFTILLVAVVLLAGLVFRLFRERFGKPSKGDPAP
jgi:hypothetical protein